MRKTHPSLSRLLLADRLVGEGASPLLSPSLLPRSPQNGPFCSLFSSLSPCSPLLPLSSLGPHPSSSGNRGAEREEGG